MMAFNIFIKIDDIKGESNDDQHKDEIEVLSFGWGENHPTTTAGGGAAGKVQMLPFHFAARCNKASPILFLACASGKHFKQAVLSLVHTAADQKRDFLVWKMSDVIVSAYRNAGEQTEPMPVDEFDLVFAKVEVEYTPFTAAGKPGQVIKAGWDLKLNKGA
jgi:type VI secretion system secreted protein Hcp